MNATPSCVAIAVSTSLPASSSAAPVMGLPSRRQARAGLAALIASLACAVSMGLATSAHAGAVEVADEINARLARNKVQQAALAASLRLSASQAATQAAGRSAQALVSSGNGAVSTQAFGNGCNIAIGNVVEDRAPSASARRETTVIITGDVIQVGNNCR